MKRFKVIFGAIVAVAFCCLAQSSPVFAGVNDFYFSDFTADYYLTKDDDGVSHLKVRESVTAVFPDYEQNKGICRQIPYTNQNGNNLTLPNLSRKNLTLTRNGQAEPIYSIEKESGYYNVCTGTEDYVLGEQTYVFEYEFTKVITEFDEKGRVFQELYWDTNGNGATQRFDSVTARLHFEDPSVFSGESWCYVGKYHESNQERCLTTTISDGLEFSAYNLSAHENLTFDVELKAGSFTIPAPEKNYIYVWFMVGLGVLCLLAIVYYLRKVLGTHEKANYYKGLFVKPEYQPSDKYRLAEMAEVYIGKKKDVKVAMLLEMITNGNIELKKGEKKKKWSIIVKDVIGLGREDTYLLAILNGGNDVNDGDEIEIKRRSATSRLISLKKSMEKKVLGDLKNDQLVEKDFKVGGNVKRGIGSVIATSIVLLPVIVMFAIFILSVLDDIFELDMTYGQEMVFYPDFYLVGLIAIVVTTILCVVLNDAAEKYAKLTKAGLEASRYMDGLKLYIEMAEAERIKFLQSVDTADISAKGIVRLYEQLLPYAAIFGLEESWMNEMKHYCELEDVAQPDYLMHGIIVSDLMRSVHNASAYATSSTVMSSSGGGSSSGFSGGGGGGFSGGGGGGGGFSGR